MRKHLLIFLILLAIFIPCLIPQPGFAISTTYHWTSNGSNATNISASGQWTLLDADRVPGSATDYKSLVTDWSFTVMRSDGTFTHSSSTTGILDTLLIQFSPSFQIQSFGICVSETVDCSSGGPKVLGVNIAGWSTTLLGGDNDPVGTVPQQVTTHPVVPEPSTLALMASGLLGLVGYRWHQCRRERTHVG